MSEIITRQDIDNIHKKLDDVRKDVGDFKLNITEKLGSINTKIGIIETKISSIEETNRTQDTNIYNFNEKLFGLLKEVAKMGGPLAIVLYILKQNGVI